MPMATAITDGNTGYSIEYELPEWMSAGKHNMRVEFSGGFLWVAPYAMVIQRILNFTGIPYPVPDKNLRYMFLRM